MAAIDIARLSLNQATVDPLNLTDCIRACSQAGIPWIGPWRHKVAELGAAESAKQIRAAGLKVSSLCRGGMFPAATAAERRARIDDNRRAIDECVALGTDVLVLVCGPAPDKNIASARQMVEDAVAELVPYAESSGVKLGIEPLHPIFAADRSVIVTLGQANALAAKFSAQVGVVIDVYHVWWDPELYSEIERARGRILGFHVNDWLAPLPDHLKGRGMMGDGAIELRRIRHAVDAAGYTGPIEVEIFNEAIWKRPAADVLERVKAAFLAEV